MIRVRCCVWLWAALAIPTAALAAPPPNDNFADAIQINGASGSANGTYIDATIEIGEPSEAGCAISVWYAWTATTSGPMTFSASAGAPAVASMIVYTGSAVSELTLVSRTPLFKNAYPWGSASFSAAAGTTYHVSVGNLVFDSPRFCVSADEFTIHWASANGPENDLFDKATLIERLSGRLEASFSGATSDGEPATVAQYGNSVWYRWTAPDSTCMVFQAQSHTMVPTIAVFTGAAAPTAQSVAAKLVSGAKSVSASIFSGIVARGPCD